MANPSAPVSGDLTKSLFDSPVDFRSEAIYFLIVDRFNDGHDALGDEEGSEQLDQKGLFDETRQDWGKYWGGNLQGVINKIDYLKSLGVTALWLSRCLSRSAICNSAVLRCTVIGPAISSESTLVF